MPQVSIWQVAEQPSPATVLLSSHCSGPVAPTGVNARLTLPSPHAGMVQSELQLATLTPIEPGSQISPAAVLGRLSPHTGIVQSPSQMSLSVVLPLSHSSSN